MQNTASNRISHIKTAIRSNHKSRRPCSFTFGNVYVHISYALFVHRNIKHLLVQWPWFIVYED